MIFEIWTEEVIAAMRQLLASGLSKGATAKALSEQFGHPFTRNMVSGKSHRLGIKYDETVRPRADKVVGGVREAIKAKAKRLAAPRINPQRFVPRVVEVKMLPPKYLSLMELTSETCRYPYGTEDPYTFCGHPPREGSPYCYHHCNLVYTEIERRPSLRVA